MIEQFTKYVKDFDMNDKHINMKYNHSIRVSSLCEKIAKANNMQDIKLLSLIGLLHDYGRFHQWKEYNTFNDKVLDHADYAIEELFVKGQITKYTSSIKDYDEIFDAIKYHNKLKIPNTLSEHNKQCTKVIRDADKLDILYMFSKGICTFSDPDHISDKVKEEFLNNKLIKFSHRKTNSDYILYTLGYIYDLNYNYSFKYLKENKIVEKIQKKVNNKDLDIYFKHIIDFINRKEKETC